MLTKLLTCDAPFGAQRSHHQPACRSWAALARQATTKRDLSAPAENRRRGHSGDSRPMQPSRAGSAYTVHRHSTVTGELYPRARVKRLQGVPGGEIQPDHAHLGAASGSYCIDQILIATGETATPMRTAQPVPDVDLLARTRHYAVAPVQMSCDFW
jgi:hypothetical protein